MPNNNRVEQLEKIHSDAKEIFIKKNQDYGDAFADSGPVGVLVRIGDKLRRFQSVSNSGINLVNDEKLEDTLLDLHNYAAMALMLIREQPKPNSTVDLTPEPTISTWTIRGSTGKNYIRKRLTYNNGLVEQQCSCPSFNYSKSYPKTCKHITSDLYN